VRAHSHNHPRSAAWRLWPRKSITSTAASPPAPFSTALVTA
jgi:hypothetical protein